MPTWCPRPDPDTFADWEALHELFTPRPDLGPVVTMLPVPVRTINADQVERFKPVHRRCQDGPAAAVHGARVLTTKVAR